MIVDNFDNVCQSKAGGKRTQDFFRDCPMLGITAWKLQITYNLTPSKQIHNKCKAFSASVRKMWKALPGLEWLQKKT